MLGKIIGFFIMTLVILFGFYLLMTKEQKRIEKKHIKLIRLLLKN